MLLCRCALGHGTHSWRSGTKQEWFHSGSTEFKFPTKFSTRQLVTRFKWRTATIGTDTCMCLKVPWSQKGILRTVQFRFEITTISNLEKRYFLKPAKLQDSESSCQDFVSFGWKDLNACCRRFWGSKRSFVSQHLIRVRAQNRFELPTFETNSVQVPPSNLTGPRFGNQSQK